MIAKVTEFICMVTVRRLLVSLSVGSRPHLSSRAAGCSSSSLWLLIQFSAKRHSPGNKTKYRCKSCAQINQMKWYEWYLWPRCFTVWIMTLVQDWSLNLLTSNRIIPVGLNYKLKCIKYRLSYLKMLGFMPHLFFQIHNISKNTTYHDTFLTSQPDSYFVWSLYFWSQ